MKIKPVPYRPEKDDIICYPGGRHIDEVIVNESTGGWCIQLYSRNSQDTVYFDTEEDAITFREKIKQSLEGGSDK